MADPITLNNASVLKGLIPPNPHALVPVDSLTASPTSSTGSASVLEWNSNSDSEFFQLSSPPSAPALTAQPASPMLSTFGTTPSPGDPTSTGAPAIIDEQYLIHWPELRYGDEAVEPHPAPVSATSTSPATASIPALNEHPAELNALIERMFATHLGTPAHSWTAASIAPSTEVPTDNSPAQKGSPFEAVATADTSMTSTVLGYGPAQPSSAMATAPTPPYSAVAGAACTLFAPPSPPRARDDPLSIAEYFKRKASERARPAADSHLQPAASPTVARPGAGAPLSYFSPPAVPPQPQPLSTAPGADTSLFQLWDRSVQTDAALRPPSPASSSGRAVSPSAPSDTDGLFGPSSPYTECASGARSPIFAPAGEAPPAVGFLHGHPSNPQASFAAFPAHGAPFRYTSVPSAPAWEPRPPELEFRDALRGLAAATPEPAPVVRAEDNDMPSSIRTWLSQQTPPPPQPQPPISSTPMRRMDLRAPPPPPPPRAPVVAKVRPPLPAVPRKKSQAHAHAEPTPQFALRRADELLPAEARAGYMGALPASWTGRLSPARSLLPPSSPALTAQPSDHSLQSMPTTAYLYGPPTPPATWRAQMQGNAGIAMGGYRAYVPPSPGATSASDDVPPVPPPAHATPTPRGPFLSTPPPPPRHTPPFVGGHAPFAPYQHASSRNDAWDWGTFNSPQERRLRFATPPSPPNMHIPTGNWGAYPYAPPPVPPPRQPQPHMPPFYPPPARHSPMPAMCGGFPGYQSYVYSSPAPVIPAPLAASGNGWYTTHKKYAFEDATVVFRVETCLFKVHRHFFEQHSDYFRKLLAAYWFAETSHLFLPDATKAEFELLLSIFYPEDLCAPDITSLQGWTTVLTLAQRWGMAQVRALALREIGALAWPAEKIVIAHAHGLARPGGGPAPAWLLPAYKAVCAARTPLDRADAARLDGPTVLGVWEVQHALRAAGLPAGSAAEDERLGQLVVDTFGPFDGGEGARGVPPPAPPPTAPAMSFARY